AHGKATAISEWGVQTDGAGAYIAAAAKWFADHGMLYQNYWESDYANYDGAFRDGSKPQSAQAFKQAFANGDLLITADQPDASLTVALPNGSTVTFDGDHVVSTNFTIAGDPTFSVAKGETATLAGRIVDMAGEAAGIVEKTGDGLLVLSAANTYSGGTHLHGGELELASLGAAGTGAITFDPGAAATLSLTASALQGTGTHDLANAITGFSTGHRIDLLGVGAARDAVFDDSRGLLTIHAADGATLATLHLAGSYGDRIFGVTSDGRGGTAVTVGDAPTAPGSLVLRVSEDAYQGDAQFRVTVDGKQVGGVQTAHASHAAGQHEDIVLLGDFGANPSLVTVQFVNDLSGGSAGADRNLYVESITVNGHGVAGNAAANYAGVNSASEAGLYYNGSALFRVGDSARNSLALTVSEDAYKGDAHFVVYVDGRQVGDTQTAHASHAAGQTETITLTGDFGANPGEVRVAFIDDLYGGSADTDRNLYVHSLTLNGHSFAGSAGENSAGWNNGGVAGLYSSGSLIFHQSTTDWHL
ncbi:carbohydrate-binding domain-containing protein, partial [Methylobacterium nigriterrae]|uniref:carbohydrate-binding domain-containing protein n=1 Tax=Methylobacterium nigriterrae TaxID=3127512 RepID=UPI00301363F6